MEEKSGKFDHNLTIKLERFGMKRPTLFFCTKCGYLEFYLKK